MTSAPPLSAMAAEAATQPADWITVAARAGEVEPVLRKGLRVAVLGCGTSWFMAQAFAGLREGAGQGVTEAFAASERRLDRGFHAVVLISRSGTTSEVIETLDEVQRLGLPHLAIVATPGTPIAERAQHAVLLPEVDERSVVQTRFATSTLALLRAHLGEDITPIADQAAAVLAESEDDALGALPDAEQTTFLGRGWSIGLAHEAALKLRESTQSWSESYPAMDYRHGPISIAAPGRTVWAMGEVPPGLADEIRSTGAAFEHREIDPMAELVRVHRLCLTRAARRGMDPDAPRNLTRSIILS